MDKQDISRGFGDTIAKITKVFGIQPCGGCERRQETLNRWIRYGKGKRLSKKTETVDASQKSEINRKTRVTTKPNHSSPPESSVIELGLMPDGFLKDLHASVYGVEPDNYREMKTFRNDLTTHFPKISSERLGEVTRRHGFEQKGLSSGIYVPNIFAGPGNSAYPPEYEKRSGMMIKPQEHGRIKVRPSCGVDVTEPVKNALRSTRFAFYSWNDSQKHRACSELHSLWGGTGAWDIVELREQVTNDVLNGGHRPRCATSGATPACGSSVTIFNTCHFAGSVNYVIFGVMSDLCHSYFVKSYANKNPSSGVRKMRQLRHSSSERAVIIGQFTIKGMLRLIDLYKKPILPWKSPAANINAAKEWAIAGYNGWPTSVATPHPDRANCVVNCPYFAFKTNFMVTWKPIM